MRRDEMRKEKKKREQDKVAKLAAAGNEAKGLATPSSRKVGRSLWRGLGLEFL